MTTKSWRGNAQAVPYIARLIPTKVALGDTFWVQINGKRYSYTLLSGTNHKDFGYIPSLINAMVAGLAVFARLYPEFAEVTWVQWANPSNGNAAAGITCTGPADGTPVTITCGATNVAGLNILNVTGTEGDGSHNEVQTVTIQGVATGGTFTLSFRDEVTSALAYNASTGTVQTALQALSTIGSGNATVSGSAGAWIVTFAGTLALADQPLLVADGGLLTVASTDAFTKTDIQTASGPNWFDVAANWSTGTAPATNDILDFGKCVVPCKFGLDHADITPAKVILPASGCQVGLPANSGKYPEYRTTALRLGTNGAGSDTLEIEIGSGDGNGCSLVRLDTGDKKTKLTIQKTARTSEQGMPAVTWKGTHASNVVALTSGSLGIALLAGETAVVATLHHGALTANGSDSSLVLGSGVTVTTLVRSGGTATIAADVTDLSQTAGTMILDRGCTAQSLNVAGGVCYSNTDDTLGKFGSITGISQANPAVVTSNGHGLQPGDRVVLSGVVGMTEVNLREFVVGVVASNTFQLLAENSTAYTAWSSGGQWAKVGAIVVSGGGKLDFSQSLTSRQVGSPIVVQGSQASVQDPQRVVSCVAYALPVLAPLVVDYYSATPNSGLGSGMSLIRGND